MVYGIIYHIRAIAMELPQGLESWTSLSPISNFNPLGPRAGTGVWPFLVLLCILNQITSNRGTCVMKEIWFWNCTWRRTWRKQNSKGMSNLEWWKGPVFQCIWCGETWTALNPRWLNLSYGEDHALECSGRSWTWMCTIVAFKEVIRVKKWASL
jgi:hypothetical protein